jgi:signal transduction histidine kinase
MAMDLSRVRDYLRPDAEADEGFRQEIRRLSHQGLRILGGTEMAIAVFAFIAQMLTDLASPATAASRQKMVAERAIEAWLIILVGLGTLLFGRTLLSRRRPRFWAGLSAFLSTTVLICSSLWLTPRVTDEYIPLHITVVLLVAVTVLPLRPLDAFRLGASMWLVYVVAFFAGAYTGLVDVNAWDASHLVLAFMLIFLSTGLSAVIYGERSANYRTHRGHVRMAQDLSSAQARALLSESAVSVGRLAAALTHELNTPLGALKSSVDTMLVVAAKQAATAQPEAQQRLVTMQAELRKSVTSSIDRLQNVIGRLQRFIDLDHSERQPIDLNELLGDVAILFAPTIKDRVKLEFNLRPLPRLSCRPQQLTTVFSCLLSNAINALNGDGRVRISSEKIESMIQVTIEDNGRGMEPADLETIFEPGFKVSGGRMSTGNWSLFSSRQIVFEHGGDIEITSTPGKGTTVNVRLPI